MKKRFSFLSIMMFVALALVCGSFFAVKGDSIAVEAEPEASANASTALWENQIEYEMLRLNIFGGQTIDNPYTWDGSIQIGENGRLWITIGSERDLAFFMKNVNGNKTYIKRNPVYPVFGKYYGTYTDYYYKDAQVTLAADLDMDQFVWTPIGSRLTGFTGTFNGNGHSIIGLRIEKSYTSSATGYLGLFGLINGSTISNLAVGIDCSAEYQPAPAFGYDSVSVQLGGIAGQSSNSTISNCAVNGQLEAKCTGVASSLKYFNDGYLGGIVGRAESTNIDYCNSYMRIKGQAIANFSIGGLVGTASNGGRIFKTANFGKIQDITHNNGELRAVGGLVGAISGSTAYKIEDCVNYLSIAVSGGFYTSKYVGGILGFGENNVTISRCVNYGDISGSNSSQYFGGIAGYLSWGNYYTGATNIIANCISFGRVTPIKSGTGYFVGEFKGLMRGNYVLGDFGNSITLYDTWTEGPTEDLAQYVCYDSSANARKTTFFTDAASYQSGGIHQYDYYGPMSTGSSTQVVSGWARRSSGIQLDVVAGENSGTCAWCMTPLVKNYFDCVGITTYKNFNEENKYALVSASSLNYFNLNFKLKQSSGEYLDFVDEDMANVTTKGMTPVTSGGTSRIYYLAGAQYYSPNSQCLYDVFIKEYDTFINVDEFAVSGSLNVIRRVSEPNFDFANQVAPISTSGSTSTNVGTISYKLSSKPFTLTFTKVCGVDSSLSMEKADIDRTNVFYYGDTFNDVTITPALGTYLKEIRTNKSNVIYSGDEKGVITISDSTWKFDDTNVTSITFTFGAVDYDISSVFKEGSTVVEENVSSLCVSTTRKGPSTISSTVVTVASAWNISKYYDSSIPYWWVSRYNINVKTDLGYRYTIQGIEFTYGHGTYFLLASGVSALNDGYSVEGVVGLVPRINLQTFGSVVQLNPAQIKSLLLDQNPLSDSSFVYKATSMRFIFGREQKEYTFSAEASNYGGSIANMTRGQIDLTYKHESSSGTANTYTTKDHHDISTLTDKFTTTIKGASGSEGQESDPNSRIFKLESKTEPGYGSIYPEGLEYEITYVDGSTKTIKLQEITKIGDLFSNSYYEIASVTCSLVVDIGYYKVCDLSDEFTVSGDSVEVVLDKNGKQIVKAKYFDKVTVRLNDGVTDKFFGSGAYTLTTDREYSFIVDPITLGRNLAENGTNISLSFVINYDKFDDMVREMDEHNYMPQKVKNVYYISSLEDLIWISAHNEEQNGFEGCIIKLTTDIDVPYKIDEQEFNFKPIGGTSNSFKGVFDGQHYTIYNLHFEQAISEWLAGDLDLKSYVGLFGFTNGATIKNLTLSGGEFGGLSNAGTFVGYAENTMFENLNAYNCEMTVRNREYGDVYGRKIVSQEKVERDIPGPGYVDYDDQSEWFVIDYGYNHDGKPIEMFGKTCYDIFEDHRQNIGGIVGYADGCTFVGVSYNGGEMINNDTGVTNFAFAGYIKNSKIDQCFVDTEIDSHEDNVYVTVSFINDQGNVITQDYYYRYTYQAPPITIPITVRDKHKDNDENWITINGTEVLKIFYWYWS